KPCSRRFGAQCILNYFPRHCGGFSPVTMLRQYHSRAARLAVMRRYRFVLVAAEAMRQEYTRHGFTPRQVQVLQYPIESATLHSGSSETVPESPCANQVRRDFGSEAVRLLFAGRMVPLKGGEVLLQSLPDISRILHRPVKLIMVGDGPAKVRWAGKGQMVCAQHPSISVEFTGWQQSAAVQRLAETCDLLVLPSLWPEPFGMIGPEAGYAQLPAVAFAVGGIPEWLHDGVNGVLAPADPPSATGLASAVAKCLASSSFHAQLRRGAKREAMKFSLDRHVNKLLAIFAQAFNEGSRV
ncbi:MAG TPA: glycosyltransferase family 4 protein, partial [Candidatus Binataceae bacterium]|nr:glycosyltransferase family 4 protein [Candidatus Binataceae bacterium]